jgi:hypothetical protein
MRKNKMTIAILGCIGIFLITALILVPTAQAGEITSKHKIASYIVKMEVVPVPDMKGHVVGILERRGVAIYENGETAAYHSRLTFDSIKGQEGTYGGYCDISFADGSITMTKFQGTVSGTKPRLIKGTAKYIKGTGRFEGIKGKGSFSGKYVTPYIKDKTKGDVFFEVTSTYTLPKK